MKYIYLLFISIILSGCNVKKLMYEQTPEGKTGKPYSKYESEQEKKKQDFDEMKHQRNLSE